MKKIGLIGFVLILVLTLFACQPNDDGNYRTGYYSLKNDAELRRLINFNQTGNLRLDGFPEMATDANNTSKTNVRTTSLDEPDVIKVDDTYIYYLSNNTLYVVEHQSLEIVLKESFNDQENGYRYFNDLMIYDNLLVLIGSQYAYSLRFEVDMMYPYFFSKSMTEILVYDISTLEVKDTYQISGYLNTVRLFEGSLFIVTTEYVYDKDQADIRPYYVINDEKVIVSYDQIHTHELIPKYAFTMMTEIKLAQNELNYKVLLGPGYFDNLYFSESMMFLSYSTYDFEDGFRQTGRILAYDYKNEFSYQGSGVFQGYILNEFAIDHYQDTLRVVTTDFSVTDVKNRLYVFRIENEALTQIGLLDENLGKPRETVRSVRFDKEQVTIVTFEQIDPFYVIDLTDPTKPTISEALEIPGFSTYQHKINDTTVLGLGYDVSNERVIGIKLSIYDITTGNLSEVGTPLVLRNDNGFQFSEALFNHRAILFDLERHYFGFSIYNYRYTPDSYEYGQDYLIFEIDLDSLMPIELVKTISHKGLGGYYYGTYIDRAVYVNDDLYVIYNRAITKHNIVDSYNLTQTLILN